MTTTNTEYPTWRYHPHDKPMLVKTPEADHALGDGWYDTPAFDTAAPRPLPFGTPVVLAQALEPHDVTASASVPPAPPSAFTPAEVWARVPVRIAVDRIGAMNLDELAQVQDWEVQHPVHVGGRKMVLRAVADQRARLAPATPGV